MGKSILLAPLLAACFAFFRAFIQSNRYASTPKTSYDFIVVGGGTAGCLVAAELAVSNPAWSVLLLEAGDGLRDDPVSEQSVPGGAPDNVAFENIDYRYRVESQRAPINGATPPGFEARSYPIPRGKGLGGSNELNYMLHVRGTPEDYDAWQKATGDTRWGAESMRGAEEEYEKKISHASKVGAVPAHSHPLAEDWVAAAGESRHGNISGSYNDPTVLRNGGFHYEHAVRNGLRQSTARQFLAPRLGLANLDVVVGAAVETVLIEHGEEGSGDGSGNARATGVVLSLAACRVPSLSVPLLGTLIPSTSCVLGGRATADVGRTLRVEAKKEVILSAGAYESPHLLLKSGVGPRAELEQAGVPTRVDLSGVGSHLQDHPIVGLKYRLGPVGGAWLPRSASKLWLAVPSTAWGWLARGQGLLASSGCDLGYFGASSPEYRGRPDLQIHGMVTAGDADFTTGFLRFERSFIDNIGEPADYTVFSEGLMIAPTLLHAKAEGRVTLRAARRPPRDDDPSSSSGAKPWTRGHPVIEYEAFGEEEDVARLTEGIRRLQAIMAAPRMAAHAPTLLHAKSLAAEFGEDSDAYWREYIRRFGFVVYHPTGTCKMGAADDAAAVVDPSLRVRGVTGLRVADASVMPDIVSGNTQVPTAAVAVQMVRILQEQYGLV